MLRQAPNVEPEDADELIRVAAAFADGWLRPRVSEYDRDERLPRDLLDGMAEIGLFGGVVPTDLGGLGLSHALFARVVEEISTACQIMGTLISMPSGLVGSGIAEFGTHDQKERWLRPLAAGQIFGAAAVTEPGSGSDVAAMRTTYRRDGDTFILNGSKTWISNLDIASFFVTFATRDPSLRHRGVSAFIIPAGTPGLSVHPFTDKLGFRPLCTGEVVFDDLELPRDALLGEEGHGFEAAMTSVERGRLFVAARSVGLARACLEDSIDYAQERVSFERPIADYQIVQSKITDMVVGIRSAQLLARDCAEALDDRRASRQAASMAKMHASDVAFRAAADAVQIHGAYGVSPEYRVGRMLRDAKVLQIVEGSNDLHRALIAEIALGLRKDH